jgi:hypothetical protein
MAQVKAIVDKLLTNVSQMYKPQGFVADQLLPLISVKQKTGKLGKYGKSHIRIEHSLVAGRGQYRRVEPIFRTDTSYSVESHGLSGLVTEDDYDNVELPFDAEKDETIGLTSLIDTNKEYAFAQAFQNSSVLTQTATLAGDDQFSSYLTSDPLAVFKTARLAVFNGCGFAPNKAVMNWPTFNTLAYHPQILDALGYTQNRAGQLSEAELAKAMGIEKLFVASGKYNSASEGQTDALANIWGNHITYYYAPDSAQVYQQSLGYRVAMRGGSTRVFKYAVNNPPNSTEILVDNCYDVLFSDITAGYLIKDVIA